MEFDIFLPRRRFEEAEGLWADRLPIDDLHTATQVTPDRIAFVGWNSALQTGIRLSYAELSERVDRIAVTLVEHGIGKGDVVAVQLPNWWEFTALFLACDRIGAVINPLMPIFRERELRFMLAFSEAKMVIVPAAWRGYDHMAMMRALRADLPKMQHVFAVGGANGACFEAAFVNRRPLSSSERQRLTACRPAPNDVAQLMFTSGTSGEPKAIMHTANTLMAAARCFIDDIRVRDSDVIFMGSPYAHQTGFLYGMLVPLMLATKAVALDIWSAQEAARLVQEESATLSMGATPFLSDMVNLPPDLRTRTSRTLRTWICAGAPIPRALVQRAKTEMNLDVLSCWGMTENGFLTITRKDDPREKVFETDGRALSGSEVRVVDDRERPVPAGTVGHLQTRGITHFVGYLKRPELNPANSDGWFDTGDLALIDRDGYIRIAGRSKDIIIRGGENIPVAEVENLISCHPLVAECAVVAMPDDRLGERACAFIVTKTNTQLDLAELTRFLGEQRMAKQYWPERLELVSELPRTPSGKVQKYKLRELARKANNS